MTFSTVFLLAIGVLVTMPGHGTAGRAEAATAAAPSEPLPPAPQWQTDLPAGAATQLSALADLLFFTCVVEHFSYQGGAFSEAATRTNVGELPAPINGSHWINNEKVRVKFVKPFFGYGSSDDFGGTTITTDKTTYHVGESPTYRVTGPAYTTLLWSSTLNGVPTGETDANYGHVTDGLGIWTGTLDPWPASAVGSWVKRVRLGDLTAEVHFDVVADTPAQPVQLLVDKSSYNVGESPLYTVIGPPNSRILWSSTLNGAPTGEVDADYGHVTDGNGQWSGYGSAWTQSQVGSWTKQIKIADRTAQASFEVLAPPPPPGAAVSLSAAHSGKCLDIPDGSSQDGVQLQQYGCHGGSNQQWRFEPVAGADTYLVRSAHSGKCLDVAGGSTDNGAAVQQWSCHGGTNQQWRLNAAPQPGQTVTLIAAHSGKCLDLAGWSTADGGVVQQWDCHGGTNQQWRVSIPGSEPPPPACGYTWYATKVFAPDEHYTGCNGTLYMQFDGNLVIYAPSGLALWASNTCCISGAYAVFQDDGNLVVYAPWGSALWASNTYAPGGRLVFQDDGNFVIYTAQGYAVWATGTFGDRRLRHRRRLRCPRHAKHQCPANDPFPHPPRRPSMSAAAALSHRARQPRLTVTDQGDIGPRHQPRP